MATPESYNKLVKGGNKPSSSGVVTSYDGLTAGDKGFITSIMETLINNALGGSHKMGGSNGLVGMLDIKLSKFTESVKSEVQDMFKKIMTKISDYDEKNDDEPCEIDEDQYKKINQESLQETFDGGLTGKITSKIHTKQKLFLGTKFLTAVLNNKNVQNVLTGLKNTGVFIKESIGGLFTTFFPNFSKFITHSMTFMKETTKALIGIGKFMYHSIVLLSSLLIKMSYMIGFALIRFVMLIGFIAMQTIAIIGSIISFLIFTVIPMLWAGVVSIISFLITTVIPIMFAIISFLITTVLPIAAGVLLLVGVVFLILFGFYLLYNFIMTWIEGGFMKAFNELISGEAFGTALRDVLKTLDAVFGLKEGTIEDFFMAFVNGDIMKWITKKTAEAISWITKKGLELIKSVGAMIVDGLAKIGNLVWDVIKPFVQPVIDGMAFLWDIFKNYWTWLEGLPLIGPLYIWLRETLMKGWDILYGWMEKVYDWVIGKLQAVKDFVGDPLGAGKAARERGDAKNQAMMSQLDAQAISGYSYKQDLLFDLMEKKGYSDSTIGQLYDVLLAGGQKERDVDHYLSLLRTSDSVLKFASGGIALKPLFAALGEAGDHEAVIPLNAQGAQFLADAMSRMSASSPMAPLDAKSAELIKDAINEEMELSGQSSNSSVGQIDKKLDALISLGGRAGRNTTSVNVSEDNTSNYIDMIAKGIIE